MAIMAIESVCRIDGRITQQGSRSKRAPELKPPRSSFTDLRPDECVRAAAI
jgi:hypothetical protein